MAFDPWFRNRLIRDAMYKATMEKMANDPSIYIMGEGSHVKVHFDAPEIEKLYPDRVLTLPISEDANTNFAVGLSLGGITPIVDVISSDFLYRTMDSICNTAAKQASTSGPRTIIIRSEFLTGGPTTGQRIESLFTHIPGLNVVIPSNPHDAYGLMKTALETKAVTLVFEDRMIEDRTTGVMDRDPPKEDIPFGKASKRLLGGKVTVVSYGIMARRLDTLLEGHGCELIDLRSLYPLDIATITKSALFTGNLLVVEPDVVHAGIGAEIIASVTENLDPQGPRVHCKRLGAPRSTIPVNHELHRFMLPSDAQVLEAIKDLVQ